MDPRDWKKVEEIFNAVSEIPPAERVRFIEEACGEDKKLRDDVLSLLVAKRKLGDFMATPPLKGKIDLETATNFILKEDQSLLKTFVGPYCLEKVIASGGMGTVYLAVRTDETYQQKVAVKLIRGGLQNREIVRRFYRERQTLANLNHPNIARLLDGGTAEQGYPYLVMEFIDGTSIDAYCDHRALNITERLKLFRQICSAVQYAHGKLVVHRDIKPANILVTRNGVPKLLDFGIVKLLDPEESLAGTHTMTVQRIMTPEYASPEQIRGESVSTSTDIFSMGIVLYELLTGHRPFRFPTTASREVERIVCDEDPPRPSTMVMQEITVTTSDGKERVLTPESVSHTREGRPERLKRRLAGDLDHIILKALRKEPDKRYASSEQLSEDIRRHLVGLPVLARKGTWKYRAGKFIKRNRATAVATGMTVLLFLMGLFLIVRESRRDANLKAAREMRGVLSNLYERPNTKRDELRLKLESDEHTRLVEELKDQPEELIEYAETIVQFCENLHLKDLAVQWWRISVETKEAFLEPLDPELPKTYFHYSRALWRFGLFEEAESMIRRALELKRQTGDEADPSLGALHHHLANVLWDRGAFDEAKARYRESLELMDSASRRDPELLIDVMVDYACFLEERGEFKEAFNLLHSAAESCLAMATERQPLGLAKVYRILGRQLWNTPRFMEAEIYLRKALELYQTHLKDEMDPRRISCMDDLVYILQESGKYSYADTTTAASVLWRLAWKRRENLFGIDSIEAAHSYNTISYRLIKRLAARVLKKVRDCYSKIWPKDHPRILEVWTRLCGCYSQMSTLENDDVEPGDCERILRDALEKQIDYHSDGHWKVGQTRFLLGINLLQQEKKEEGLAQINHGLILLERVQGRDHPSNASRLLRSAQVCDGMNYIEEAENYRMQFENRKRLWPYGCTIMDCDLTRERYSRIDFEDDNLEKIIILPDGLDGYSKAYLWIYGRPENYEWEAFRDIENARIRVNHVPEQEIPFNIPVKFLHITNTFQWVPFEIPLDWLKEGENTFDLYITHDPEYKKTHSWLYNNLSVGIDTAYDHHHSWWVGASAVCCKEFSDKVWKSKKPLPRDSDLFIDHRAEGFEECEGELMIFLELHRRRDR